MELSERLRETVPFTKRCVASLSATHHRLAPHRTSYHVEGLFFCLTWVYTIHSNPSFPVHSPTLFLSSILLFSLFLVFFSFLPFPYFLPPFPSSCLSCLQHLYSDPYLLSPAGVPFISAILKLSLFLSLYPGI